VLLLAVALVVPATALAATEEGLSTYNETKTTTSAAEPTQSTAPATATAPAKELPKTSTLPFTGLDLGNVVLVGFLLIGAGTSIVVVQRRRSVVGGRGCTSVSPAASIPGEPAVGRRT
jgi:hypothetical protein